MLLWVLCASAVTVFSCAAPARTTRLQTRDFQEAATEIATSLRRSDFLRERTQASEPIVIAITKVENLSSDLLSEGEKWFLVDRVMNSDMMAALRQERNIRFVIPAERLEDLAAAASWAGPIGQDRAPTHSMTAALRNVTRSAGVDRTDLYAAEYTITRIESGETAWTGEYLVKRTAVGRAYN